MHLDERLIRTAIEKTTAVSYGLTLVAGMPFAPPIPDEIRSVQDRLAATAPGVFTWYDATLLHATLAAPLRGRYRTAPPLQRAELPADLDGFTEALNAFFSALPPFAFRLRGVRLMPDGFVVVSEDTVPRRLTAILHPYPELDPPKHLQGLQVVVGRLNTPRPFASDRDVDAFAQTLDALDAHLIGEVEIRQVRLVHYAKRSLATVLGQVAYDLGVPNRHTPAGLLHALGIDGGE